MDSMEKIFLNKKRAEESEKKPKIELPKEENVDIKKIINDAFDCFIKDNRNIKRGGVQSRLDFYKKILYNYYRKIKERGCYYE